MRGEQPRAIRGLTVLATTSRLQNANAFSPHDRQLLVLHKVPRPVASGIAKWVYRQTSRDVCPWNERFARELKVPEFAPRTAIVGRDVRMLACELLAMSQEDFSRSFKNSPMKRTKLSGLKRNAAIVLSNVDGGAAG